VKYFFFIGCFWLFLPAKGQAYGHPDTLNKLFAGLESFLYDYNECVQFRELGADTLSFRQIERYRNLFSPGCLHPDILNPTVSKRGEPILSGARYRKVDEFLTQVAENYPQGLFVRVRALNANFAKISERRAVVVMERKSWGNVKGRWRLEVVDTLSLHVVQTPSGNFMVDRADLVGFGYLLTDVKRISQRTARAVREPDLRALKRAWERRNIPKKRLPREALLAETEVIPDSVAMETMCTYARRTWFGTEIQEAVKESIPVQINPSRLESPLIVYSDRFGNSTSVSPESQAEMFRDLRFMQPLYVVDVRGEYAHVVEFIYGGVDLNTGEIRKCLEDMGWISINRLLYGTEPMRDTRNGRFMAVAGQPESAQGKKEARVYYETPDRSREYASTTRETALIYIHKIVGDAALVGTKSNATPMEYERTILGWIKLSDITPEFTTP
jgi:hypothetical protein